MKEKLNLIYGKRPCHEVIKHSISNISRLQIVTGTSLSGELDIAIAELKKNKTPVEFIDKNTASKLTDGGVHQGIIIHLQEYKYTDLKELIGYSLSSQRNGLLIVLDQITDPQNLGAIIRTSEVAGVDGIIMTTDHSTEVTPVVRKASAGASELLPVTQIKNLANTLKILKDNGFWIVGTSLEAKDSLYKVDFPHPLAFVFGSEGEGIRELTKKLCDILIYIPMAGKIDSLNVSQSVAVTAFEMMRQRLAKAGV